MLAGLYRRWKFVEEEAPAAASGGPAPADERARLQLALQRDRKMVAHYRRNGCDTLARDREASVHALERRLLAMDMAGRRSP
jgi:hypothetical protein